MLCYKVKVDFVARLVKVMDASKSKAGDESDSHEVWTVLPHHMGGGPHGLGASLLSFLLGKPCECAYAVR